MLFAYTPELVAHTAKVHDLDGVERGNVIQLFADRRKSSGRDGSRTFNAHVNVRALASRAAHPGTEEKDPILVHVQVPSDDRADLVLKPLRAVVP